MRGPIKTYGTLFWGYEYGKKTLVSFRFQQGARLLIHSIPKAMMAYHVLMTKCKQSLKHGAWWLPGWVLGILGDPI